LCSKLFYDRGAFAYKIFNAVAFRFNSISAQWTTGLPIPKSLRRVFVCRQLASQSPISSRNGNERVGDGFLIWKKLIQHLEKAYPAFGKSLSSVAGETFDSAAMAFVVAAC
jgi:hypothetical protein